MGRKKTYQAANPNSHPFIKGTRNYQQGRFSQVRRRIAQKGPKVYTFKRSHNFGTGTTVSLTPTLVAQNYSLNDLPNYAEFTALFDFYKITGIRIRLLPYQTESNSTGTVNNAANVPIFHVVDTSDATAPTTVEELCEYQDHKISNLYSGFDVYFKPKFADATSATRDGWVVTTNPSLNYFGFKYAIPPTTNSMTFYIVVTYYLSFKDPK